MLTAKIFTNGRSQAVRLPKECQLAGKAVYVRKFNGLVMLIPQKSPWTSLVKSLGLFSDDFMEDRTQPPSQKRKL